MFVVDVFWYEPVVGTGGFGLMGWRNVGRMGLVEVGCGVYIHCGGM